MPAIKLKISGKNARKGSAKEKPEPSASRKKRRVISGSDDEDEDEFEPESEEGEDETAPGTSRQKDRRRSMSQPQVPNPDKLFEDDTNVSVVDNADAGPSDIPDRAPTPAAAPSAPARKRGGGRKKAATVYSDEDDEYVDSGRRQDDKDEDFVVDDPAPQPPRRGGAGKRGGAGGGRGRGRGAAKEKGGGEIHIKDERKLPPTARPAGGDAKAGAKRRRETVSEAKPDTAVDVETSEKAFVTQVAATVSLIAGQLHEGSASTAPPPSKIRKLPPIKKNKSLAGATTTAPSSGPSTPSGSAATASKAGIAGAPGAPGGAVSGGPGATAPGLPLHTSLPRKPVQKTSDLDLSSPDIYNSLFKAGSAAPRLGVNSRLKEEERRKELMKMRDEARVARMANLQKNSFDLLAAHDKIQRFEAKLQARNSPALYPNHLGSSLKFIVAQRKMRLSGSAMGAGPG